MIKNESINLLVKKFHENKLSHIFLVETNHIDNVLNDIIEFIKVINCPENFNDSCKKCNLCHLITTNSLPSLKIIAPDGQNIKKVQMEELKSDFATMPYLSKYNVYVIQNAEKLNASSANTILKFIEEPEDYILGFLITNNRENVINTIKSRCELVQAIYPDDGQACLDERIFSLAIDYLEKLEVEKQRSIVYNKVVLDEKLEREEVIALFKVILNIYLALWHHEEVPEKLKKLEDMEKERIIKRIEIVTQIIEQLQFNVNINLLLDSFVLELED